MQTQQYLVTSPLTSKHNLNKRAEVTICVLQHSQISCKKKSQFSKCTKIQSTPQLPYKACLYNLLLFFFVLSTKKFLDHAQQL